MINHKDCLHDLVFLIKDIEKNIISLLDNADQKNKTSSNIVFETDVYKKQLKENMYMLYETKNILWAERRVKDDYYDYTKITILVSEKIVKKYLYYFIDLKTKVKIMYEELKYLSKLNEFWSDNFPEYSEYDMLCDLVVDCYKIFKNIKDKALSGYYTCEYIFNEELEKKENLMTMYLNQNRRLKGYLYNYYPKVWVYDGLYPAHYNVWTDLSDEEIKKYIPEILALRNKFIRLKDSFIKTCFKQEITKGFDRYFLYDIL